ncbi:hypothetical protein OCU04_006854 [Sclerotinia nivalis]|uniref:Uncharacterized protein n=1 Tax=Sclerotinia nivalis TaxID=352851 RepID=A0A9X0ALK1_9HELO|nr:hypothetical protein OCU04_006854 [Sclerotinia nivalis]
MPKKQFQQPSTPENLPELLEDSSKKMYYVQKDRVHYLETPDATEWKTGVVAAATQSISMPIIIDSISGDLNSIRVEYVRAHRQFG